MSKEELAAKAAHDIWANWMQYMFTCGHYGEHGEWIMNPDKYDRWERQMDTPYEGLSEAEKQSDREVAEQFILPLLNS